MITVHTTVHHLPVIHNFSILTFRLIIYCGYMLLESGSWNMSREFPYQLKSNCRQSFCNAVSHARLHILGYYLYQRRRVRHSSAISSLLTSTSLTTNEFSFDSTDFLSRDRQRNQRPNTNCGYNWCGRPSETRFWSEQGHGHAVSRHFQYVKIWPPWNCTSLCWLWWNTRLLKTVRCIYHCTYSIVHVQSIVDAQWEREQTPECLSFQRYDGSSQ